MASYQKVITTAASVTASVMLVRSVVNELMPYEVREMLSSGLGYLRSYMSSQHTIIIEENEGWSTNYVYDAVQTYLATRINTNMQRLRVSSMDEYDNMTVSMVKGEEMSDTYEGTEFKWCLITCTTSSDSSNNGNGSNQHEARSLEVTFHKKHKEKALKAYLPFIVATARALLYGPPGTGKSSLIAAMANHLRFDIYDLELTEVNCNSELRRLLVGMTNRSILVVEDIDCTIELKQREEGEERAKSTSTEDDKGGDKVTLSGLLNFVDGLWSTNGEERIIVFTTNYKERLDAALLRPGRMDMHIHMGYCTTEAFRILVNNYHSIDYHVKYPEIEELIKEVMVTPAEVAEVLMRNDDTEVALHGLVELLKSKMKDANEIKTENKDGSKQVEEKKDDSEMVAKNDSTKNESN